MERAAAGTPLRRERGLVAPREGVITAPGLIPAEVPGVTFPSSRAVVSVALGGGGGEREREGAASPREAAALRTPRRAAGAARCVLRCGAAAQFSPPRDPPPPSWGPQLSLCAAHPHSLSSHTGSASTGPSPRVLPALSYTLAPASPPWAPPPRRAGAAVVPVPGECSVQTKKRAI